MQVSPVRTYEFSSQLLTEFPMRVMMIGATAALLMAGAAGAQTTGTTTTLPDGMGTPPAAGTSTESTTSTTTTDTTTGVGGQTAPGQVDATTGAGTADMLVEKDGKWMKGDREATKAEIAAHKKAMKSNRPT